MTSRISLVALVAGLFVLAGCAGDNSGDDKAEAAETVTVTVTATPTEAATSTPSETAPSDDDPSIASFGESVSYENGLQVSISKPVRFTPVPKRITTDSHCLSVASP
jgi:PBP1b-binding outer membrane lipoprotein LpoB